MRDIDRQLAEMEAEEATAAAARRGAERRLAPPSEEAVAGGGASGGGRRAHPQSCNLEQLYHEALPLSKALSHSGPPAFGDTGQGSSWVILNGSFYLISVVRGKFVTKCQNISVESPFCVWIHVSKSKPQEFQNLFSTI